jgi:hypothetical protein
LSLSFSLFLLLVLPLLLPLSLLLLLGGWRAEGWRGGEERGTRGREGRVDGVGRETMEVAMDSLSVERKDEE